MVTIDIETTGLSKKDCGICQLSMVKTNDNFEVIDTFNHYIKPKPSLLICQYIWRRNREG